MEYKTILPNDELRAYARLQLSGFWGKMVFAYFIYYLILLPFNIVSAIDSINNALYDESSVSGISNLLAVAVLITSGPFSLGFAGYFLKRVRGEEIFTRNIFDGFKRFIPSLLAAFFIGLFTFLWSLLLIIPGIVKGLGYSMVFNIMYDNPEMKPRDALKKSQIMMNGYKLKYFLLQLSFVGWAFLCLLTLGVGLLWLNPYIYLSVANFYENLKINQEASLPKVNEVGESQIFS